MRKIKFRGRVSQPQYNLSLGINEKPFIIGSLTINEDMYCIYPTGQTRGYFVEKETVGQFTGLHDKNGKEIYEGDILNYHHTEYDGDGFYATVVWQTSGFMLKHNKTGYLSNIEVFVNQPLKYELIGNIHEEE